MDSFLDRVPLSEYHVGIPIENMRYERFWTSLSGPFKVPQIRRGNRREESVHSYQYVLAPQLPRAESR